MTSRDLATAAAFLRQHDQADAERTALLRILDALARHLVFWPWPGFAQAVAGAKDADLPAARDLFDAWRAQTYTRVLDQRAAVEAASDAGLRRNHDAQMAWCQGVLRALPPLGGPQ